MGWIQGTSANIGRGWGGEIGTPVNVDRGWGQLISSLAWDYIGVSFGVDVTNGLRDKPIVPGIISPIGGCGRHSKKNTWLLVLSGKR